MSFGLKKLGGTRRYLLRGASHDSPKWPAGRRARSLIPRIDVENIYIVVKLQEIGFP